jgi:hypothetical protein
MPLGKLSREQMAAFDMLLVRTPRKMDGLAHIWTQLKPCYQG